MYDQKHFQGAKKFWYQGNFYDWNKPVIHCMSHALHYGTSVFEGIRAYSTPKGPAIFRLPEHVDRLFYSASVLGLEIPFSKEKITSSIVETIKENELTSAYIRPLVFFSYGTLALLPQDCSVEVVIATWEWDIYLGDRIRQEGAKVLILPVKRFHHSQIVPSAKLGGLYVQSQIGIRYAKERGFDEGIFLNLEGNIAEGSGENIFIVKNKVIKTNFKSESILEGITQKSIIEIARDLGYQVEIGKITKNELFKADEAFFTGTATEIAPIVSVWEENEEGTERTKHLIGKGKPGEITLHLYQSFLEIVQGKNKKFERWLTYVQ